MTESTKIDYVSIVQDLRDEADLCRNETATDIADLLDDAASCIVAMKSQFTALRSELAAAQEARQRAEEEDFKTRMMYHDALERAQRAEALAERYRRTLQQFANNNLSEENCSSVELAGRRVRNVARAAIAGEKP